MTTNLVVADMSRTEKTIGLAVSPSLKSFGIPGRPRLFEVVQKVKEVNNERRRKAGKLVGESYNINELNENPSLAVGYIVAPPRMAHYMDYSTRIYQVYLKHVAPEDIHVYSIDEVFIDATGYLKTRGMNGHEFAQMLIRDVLATTGITATAGIGTHLYLAKVAMDIKAKKMPADEDGVRIAEIDALRRTEAIDKLTFGSSALVDVLKAEKDIESIAFVGLCTDICVISNAMVVKAFFPEVPLIVDAKGCAGVSPDSHQRALEATKVCQIKIINN